MIKFIFREAKNTPISDADLLDDLSRIAKLCEGRVLTQKLYKDLGGKYDATSTFNRRFGSWTEAVKLVGLIPGNPASKGYSDEVLFENIANLWEYKGSQPVRSDLAKLPSKISSGPYLRRFESWTNALKEFVFWANSSESNIANSNIKPSPNGDGSQKTSRNIALNQRFRIFERDNFTCVKCGRSRAKGDDIKLECDHIIPYTKGGETIDSNLQTLCYDCNRGKSNRFSI